jgi:hypothetical protein
VGGAKDGWAATPERAAISAERCEKQVESVDGIRIANREAVRNYDERW